jgi:hypothetical protein
VRFLFDVHVHHGACSELRQRGIDVMHAVDAGLGAAPDEEVLAFAAREDRILITRNCADFARLTEAYARFQQSFPGVLFFPRSLPAGNPCALTQALEVWLARLEPGMNPVRDTFGYLSSPSPSPSPSPLD